MSDRARVEVEDSGRGGVIVYVDLERKPTDPAVVGLIDQAIDDLVAATDLHRHTAAWALAGEIAFRIADARAYDREVERRGVLF